MMKSTQKTRDALCQRLESALLKNPNNKELQEALDIVNDVLKYHKLLTTNKAVYVLYDTNAQKVYFYEPSDMSLLNEYKLDSSHSTRKYLGIALEVYLEL